MASASAAAAQAPRLAPTQAVLTDQRARDYLADREVIRCADGLRFILRTVARDSVGVAQAVVYTAWEPATENEYAVTRVGPNGKAWGRTDSVKWDGAPVENRGRLWTGEDAQIYWGFKQQARAHELIRATCPETIEGYKRPDGISLAFVRAPERLRRVE